MSCTSTWISYGIWICPCTAWMRTLLSPSMWMLVNPTCTAALIPFRIVVASANKMDAAPKLSAPAWMNLHVQLLIIYPPDMRWVDLNPSKLSLMNPSGGFFHAIQYVFFRLIVKKCGSSGWIDCVSLCLMCHSALAFLL